MSITRIDIESFLQLPATIPVLDVRSPGEFEHAHIPGAFSLPLFTNGERSVVGTTYKQQSREAAIKIALGFFGKKMVSLVETAEKIIVQNPNATRAVTVHCWRGGMRSAAVAWLLDVYGFRVNLLQGGYKAYRRWALGQLEKEYNLVILGGYTGSNKTAVLKELDCNHKVIDLEAIASHKGSAFGNLNLIPQPSQEFFENMLAATLHCHTSKNHDEIIWVEGESQRLGLVNIPLSFFKNMRKSQMIFLNIPFEKRLELITIDYGKYDKEKIINAILRIKKRLGGLETKTAVNFVIEDDIKSCFSILLKYYDKLYLKSIEGGEFETRKIIHIESVTTNAHLNLKNIISYAG